MEISLHKRLLCVIIVELLWWALSILLKGFHSLFDLLKIRDLCRCSLTKEVIEVNIQLLSLWMADASSIILNIIKTIEQYIPFVMNTHTYPTTQFISTILSTVYNNFFRIINTDPKQQYIGTSTCMCYSRLYWQMIITMLSWRIYMQMI